MLWFRVKNLYVGSGVVTDRTTSLQMRLFRSCRRLCAFGNHYAEGCEHNQPLATTAGATTDVARIDFNGCTRFQNCTYGHVTDATIGPRSLVVSFVVPS